MEGAEGLLDVPQSSAAPLPFIPDSKATTTAALREDFNQLLAALRGAGLMAANSAQNSAE